MLNGRERRRFFRHPIHAPLLVKLHAAQDPFSAEADDLSLGGLSFISHDRLSRGSLIDVRISVKEKRFDIRGRVAYSQADPRTGRFKNGIHFVDSPSAFKAKLAEEALEILQYRKLLSQKLCREVSEDEAADIWIREYADRFAEPD